MRTPWLLSVVLIPTGILFSKSLLQDGHDALESRAESSDYTETSRYDEVVSFIEEVGRRSDLVRIESFGHSEEGRALPLVILHDPPVASPDEARATSKPIVMVNNNIHAGEVEGKEAALHMIRDLTDRDDPLLREIVLLIAPIYNADGNEKVDLENRPRQHGPSGGVGQRANAQGLDLNRDFTKLHASETRGLVGRVFRDWDPHVFIDCHTTNGSYHGYALTYEPSLHPDVHPRITAIARDELLPWVTKRVKEKAGYDLFYYGNFVNWREQDGGWQTYDWRPRYGTNYYGLRNRFSVLSEAYAYFDYRRRIEVTEEFVFGICRWVADHASLVTETTKRVDRETIDDAREGSLEGATAFEVASLGDVPIIVEKVLTKEVEGSRRPRVEQTGEFEEVVMPHLGRFEGKQKLPLPNGYVIPASFQDVVENLRGHGVVVEQLLEDTQVEAEVASLVSMDQQRREFQGVKAWKLDADLEDQVIRVPAGAYFVSSTQRLARLVFHLLEAESDDGYASWGFLDRALEPMAAGEAEARFPIIRLKRRPDAETKVVE